MMMQLTDQYLLTIPNQQLTIRQASESLAESIIFLLLAELKANYSTDQETKYHRIPIDKLQHFYGKNINLQEIGEATKNILSTRYHIKDGKKVLTTPLISSANMMPSENILEIGVTNLAYPYLLRLRKRFLHALNLHTITL